MLAIINGRNPFESFEKENRLNNLKKDGNAKSGYAVYKDYVIPFLLIQGNDKIGKSVWHFSTLPTCENGGTCFCTCKNSDGKITCYGVYGRYTFQSVKDSLARKTWIVRNDLDWFTDEIIHELNVKKVKYCRIHVTGDFFSAAYVMAWFRIACACPNVKFWTYTKSFGHGFDAELNLLNSLPNVNIVKSVIPGCGFNYGHCDHILDIYYKLLSENKTPYICPCGYHDDTHCSNCRGCSENEHVLFIEHSTDYDAKSDPLYPEVCKLIDNQKSLTD